MTFHDMQEPGARIVSRAGPAGYGGARYGSSGQGGAQYDGHGGKDERLGSGAVSALRRPPAAPGARPAEPDRPGAAGNGDRSRLRRRQRHPLAGAALAGGGGHRDRRLGRHARQGGGRAAGSALATGRHRGLGAGAAAGPDLFERGRCTGCRITRACSRSWPATWRRAACSRCRCRAISPNRPTPPWPTPRATGRGSRPWSRC